jgi:hypothetical protein
MAKAKNKYGSTYDPKHKTALVRDPARFDWAAAGPAEYEYVTYPVSGADLVSWTANPFTDKVLEMEYVGSRVSCNPPPEGTDEDILILTDKAYRLVEDCKAQGFVGGEFYFGRPGKKDSEFVSIRKGDINLIVTEDKGFYDKFLLATHVCKTLNVMEKVNRVMVFQAILYGNKKEGKP